MIFRTCENLLLEALWQHLEINDALDDALQRPELRVQPQREQHEEEEQRPHVAPRELVHGLREQDESEPGARGGLEKKKKFRKIGSKGDEKRKIGLQLSFEGGRKLFEPSILALYWFAKLGTYFQLSTSLFACSFEYFYILCSHYPAPFAASRKARLR